VSASLRQGGQPRPPTVADVGHRYYVLVAACVLGRRNETIRNIALAGAMLIPAVSALHGITLAAGHIDGKA
jgi:hypothetical protein